jgi:hypothetical protein
MKPVIFHNKNGKELFRSENVRVNFRYYELDRHLRQKKVEFVVDLIQFEDLGNVSAHYLCKVLKRACNGKIPKPPVKIEYVKKWPIWANRWMRFENHRRFDVMRARIRKHLIYLIYTKIRTKTMKFSLNFQGIFQKFIIKPIETKAPP